MELWNDFEGKDLDGRFRLERLLSPKGRSAFFSGRADGNEPVTIRVIESLNDEDEILARWTAVQAARSTDLLELRTCGKTVLDGTHLVYAVLEPTEAELADVLRERVLTAEETRQVAAAVVGGLEALHARGLVHEHVDATSVRAAGESVKLRSDCVREAPEGAEGEEAKRKDVRDLALLVGFALTGQREAALRDGGVRVPRPFDELVRHGLNGTWGLREMALVVRPLAPVAVATPVAPRGVGPAVVRPAGVEAKAAVARPMAPAVAGTAVAARPAAAAGRRPVAGEASGATSPAAVAAALAAGGAAATPAMQDERHGLPDRREPEATGGWRAPVGGVVGAAAAMRRGGLAMEPETAPRWGLWAGVAVAVVLLLALIAHFAGGKGKAVVTAPVASPAAVAPAGGGAVAAAPAVAVKPSAARTMADRGTRVVVGHGNDAAAGAQWRVVAYTYLRQDQAEHKSRELAEAHPDLHPEVFAPTGRSPYLVALGGWMTQDEAMRLKTRERGRAGLPRDLYAQNYHHR